MLAHVLVRNDTPNHSFELKEVAVPELMAGEVRIKVKAFGLNHADLMARQGLYRECPPLPCIIGYDVEGIIDALAPDVDKFKLGDRVFGLTRFGGYAQYAVANAGAIGFLPEGTEVGTGCALATQNVTGYYSAMVVQQLVPGEKVLIHAAAGGLGTALIQIAQWKRCIVIGVAGGKDKADYLKQMGVTHVINHQETSYLDYVKEHFNGQVDVVFDNIGGSSFKKAKSILAVGGRIISLGAAGLNGKKGIYPLLKLVIGFGLFSPISFLRKSQSLIGINMLALGDNRPDLLEASFEGVMNLYSQGILKPYIGKVFSQNNLGDAHAFMQDRKSIGKNVVVWDEF